MSKKTDKKHKVMAFTFGDPEEVLSGQLHDYLGAWLLDNGQYYMPPVSLKGLAKLRGANAYHWPALEFKVNVAMVGFRPNAAVTRKTMVALATDYAVFHNCYAQMIRNMLGEVVQLRHLAAINMRRLKEPDRYGQLQSNGNMVKFQPGEVLHIKAYDVAQGIYGVPSYLGAIQSMLLNEDATLFRRRYYKNGAHLGYIFYSSSANLDQKSQDALQTAIQGSKGLGNFKNMYLHIPEGREKDIQIIPVGDFSTKDELEKIKNISRDDIIAAHRIPPAMACLIPTNTGGFGDITKIDEVFQRNEIQPFRETLAEVNEVLPERWHVRWEPFDNTANQER